MPSSHTAGSVLSVAEVTALLDANFPQINSGGRSIIIEAVNECRARVRLKFSGAMVRPGGTISGPTMFTLADFSIYVALIATRGAEAIPAVTSNLNISFLKRPEPRDLVAEAHVVRLGRRLAYAAVTICSDGSEEAVAHATGTYAMPPSV